MEKQTQLKAAEVLRSFLTSLDVIEKEINIKLAEAEKQANDNAKLTENLKIQEKENEKRWRIKVEKVSVELKSQEIVSQQIAEELTKQSNLTKDIEKAKIDIIVNSDTSELTKKQLLEEMDKQRKLTIEVKSRKEEQEKLLNTNIERSKKLDSEFNRLNIREAELNRDKSKLEKDKIDFGDRQTDLEIRIKNIERVEKAYKLKNG